VYADTADSQARHSLALGRLEDAERLEGEVYEIAEAVLARRPGDIRSMKNRALAADLLGRIASRRQDFDAATRYAARSEQAGEDIVRFNPGDLGSWLYWIRGRQLAAGVLLQQGKVSEAIAKRYSIVGLADDQRLPSSLQPMLEEAWYSIAELQMASGQSAAAERSFAAGVKATEEAAAQQPEGSVRRTLTMMRPPGERALLALQAGDYAAALDKATAVVNEVERLRVDENDTQMQQARNDGRQWMLEIVADSAIRLGRYEQAEAASRRSLDLPPVNFGDPAANKARQHLRLAHALARQGKGAEALAALAPALEHYRSKKAAGATGTDFRLEYAEALLVSALTQSADPAGRRARQQALRQAAAELAGVTDEVRQLSETRVLAGWIAAASGPAGA
jgi:tetratricopeptide (TPR) repeat protein